MIQVSLSPQAKRNLDKRIANIKWTLLEQAQYRAMLKANNIVKKTLYKEWETTAYSRNGEKQLHRKAILKNVQGKIKRPGKGQIIGFTGIGRKDKYTSVVNIIDPGFIARTGATIAGKGIREKVFLEAVKQAELFTQYLGETAKKMLAGR
jgi:hypothetical protein